MVHVTTTETVPVNAVGVQRDLFVTSFGPGSAMNLPVPAAEELFHQSARRRFGPGDVLFHAGDAGDAVYLICDGRVSLRSLRSASHPVTTLTVGRGGVVGLHTVFESTGRHPCSAQTMTRTSVREVRREVLLSMCATSPALALALGRVVAHDSAAQSDRVAEMCWEKAPSRVRRRVVELIERFGVSNSSGFVSIDATHEEVADLAGVTRPTASSVIQTAAKAGLIRTSRGRMEVVDLDGLRAWGR
jgi:CRP/FNR family transcriptional regulator, cyclic AMP receptor protein